MLLSKGLATLALTVRKQFCFLDNCPCNVSTCGVCLVEVHVNSSECSSCGVLAEKCEKTLSMFSSNNYIASQEERFSAGSAKKQNSAIGQRKVAFLSHLAWNLHFSYYFGHPSFFANDPELEHPLSSCNPHKSIRCVGDPKGPPLDALVRTSSVGEVSRSECTQVRRREKAPTK